LSVKNIQTPPDPLKRWKDSSPNAGITYGLTLNGDAFVELAAKYKAFAENRTILELGPGYGRILASILSKGIKFKSYLGVDISKLTIKYLQSKFGNPAKGIHFIEGDFARVDFGSKYDVVLSSITLKHQYPTFEQALKHVCEYLNKDAILFFDLIENKNNNLKSEGIPAKSVWYDGNTYVAYYTRAEIEEILKRLQLSLIGFDYVIHHQSKGPRLVVIARQTREGKAVINPKQNIIAAPTSNKQQTQAPPSSQGKGAESNSSQLQMNQRPPTSALQNIKITFDEGDLEEISKVIEKSPQLQNQQLKIISLENKIKEIPKTIEEASELIQNQQIKIAFLEDKVKEFPKALEDVKAAIQKQDEAIKAITSKLTEMRFRVGIMEGFNKSIKPTKKSLYARWLEEHLKDDNIAAIRAQLEQFKLQPKISIVMPVYKIETRWLIAAIESVRNQLYTNWELCICDDGSKEPKIKEVLRDYSRNDSRIKVIFSKENNGISQASNKALALATGDYVALLDHDDEISRDALFEVVKAINNNPNVDYIYTDEDKINENSEHSEPFFKPDWSPDLLLSMNYLCHFSIIRTKLIRLLRGFRKVTDGSQDYDLLLRVTEKANDILHIPKVLYHWRIIAGSSAGSTQAKPYAYVAAKKALRDALERRGLKGSVSDITPGVYRIKYDLIENPLVSIIILNKNNAKLLKTCIESIQAKTTYKNYEIIIVDHSSTDNETLEYLKTLKFQIIKYEGKFNFSRMNNLAARAAHGKHLLFLNNDTEVIEPSWIESLLEHSQHGEVGAVGAKLFYPDGSIQHAGIIVGFNRAATNYSLQKDDPGYFGFANVIRNCSAVTAACIMVRRDVFESVNGFDEELAQSWQDVDLCLRILSLGKRIVYTPYCRLYHITGATRGRLDQSPEEEAAVTSFRDRHKRIIEYGDPYYNPNLSLMGQGFSLDFSFVTDPMDMLIAIYNSREDLQKAMPEVQSGNFERLIRWAADHGTMHDSANMYLGRFAQFYQSFRN